MSPRCESAPPAARCLSRGPPRFANPGRTEEAGCWHGSGCTPHPAHPTHARAGCRRHMSQHMGTPLLATHRAKSPSPRRGFPGKRRLRPRGDCPRRWVVDGHPLWGDWEATGPRCFPGQGALGAQPLLPSPPGPWGHRLLWANKPRAEAQLVTGVSCLPQPWGRNTVSQGQAPAWAGWAGTPAGPPLQAGSQQAPVTRVLEFSARRGARCSQIPSSSCARSRRLAAADSRHWQGEPGGDPWPRASVGGQWGPPGAWGPPSSPAPH